MVNSEIADRYRPDLIGLFVASSAVPDLLQVYVDPDRPRAWIEGGGRTVIDHLRAAGHHLFVLVGDEHHLILAEGKPPPLLSEG